MSLFTPFLSNHIPDRHVYEEHVPMVHHRLTLPIGSSTFFSTFDYSIVHQLCLRMDHWTDFWKQDFRDISSPPNVSCIPSISENMGRDVRCLHPLSSNSSTGSLASCSL